MALNLTEELKKELVHDIDNILEDHACTEFGPVYPDEFRSVAFKIVDLIENNLDIK